jgi:hypothetical protein
MAQKILSLLKLNNTKRKVLSLSLSLLLALMPFQNCANKVSFKSNSSLAVDPGNGGGGGGTGTAGAPSGSFKINNGAAFTNNIDTMLTLNATDAVSMIITNGTCPTGSEVWLPVANQIPWTLSDADGKSDVFMMLQSSTGLKSNCINASIGVDRVAPLVNIAQGPAAAVADQAAHFVVNATDAASGVDQFFCRTDDQVDYSLCANIVDKNMMAEGSRTFYVYVSDKAGNKSNIVTQSWLVDITKPTIAFSDPLPPSPSLINSATFLFAANDGAGSGVASYECLLNGAAVANCQPPVKLNSLNDGAYIFEVRAQDQVGNYSNYISYNFSVDTKPSGAFQILGISGGSDISADAYFNQLSNPVVSWSSSLGAQSYNVSIFAENGIDRVCGPAVAAGSAISSGVSGCTFVENAKYIARVSSVKNGLTTLAPDYLFTVDTSAPVINIVKSATSASDISVDFTIVDVGVGVASAICHLNGNGQNLSQDCSSLSTVAFSGLSVGTYSFTIYAIDIAGNNVTSPAVNLTINPATPAGTDKFTITPVVVVNPEVDMIWVIDNSGSMAQEAAWVRTNLLSFANYVSAQSSIKLAVISAQGTTGQKVTIPTGDPRFMQINQTIGSNDALKITKGILEAVPNSTGTVVQKQAFTLNGFLRPNAQKVFVFVTDDESTMLTSTDFMVTLGRVFANQAPIVNGFVGFGAALSPCEAAYGAQYFNLGLATGGDMFNICSTDWTPHFAKLAKSVINSSVNNIFTLSQAVVTGITSVTVNGVAVAAADFTLSGNTIVISKSLLSSTSTSTVEVKYTF